MRKTIFTALALTSMFIYNSNAQQETEQEKLDDIIITADSKTELKRTESGKPVVRITRTQIEAQAATSVAALLNQVAGIEINGARSNSGQNLGIFIRGGNNRQVSFLIDGAQVNDPSGIASDFDLRLIAVDQIEEIEILKGASSSLYGANASTAVINIKLKKTAREAFKLSLNSFIATNKAANEDASGIDSFETTVNASGTLASRLTYGLTFAHQSTDGISAAQNPNSTARNDSDPFNRINLLGRIGYDNNKNVKLTSYVSFDEYRASFDNFDFTDAPNETLSKQVRWGTNMVYKYSDKGSLVYNDVSTHTKRDTRSGFPTIFNANGYSLDLYNTYDFAFGASTVKTIAGFNMRLDSFESFSVPFGSAAFSQDANSDIAQAQIYDPYINLLYLSDYGFNFNAGARLNVHSNYDSKLVYTINPSYRLKVGENTLKGYASYGTAYVAPSLFQLYDGTYGNQDLNPELNATLEAGIELVAAQSLISVSVFTRNEKNLVVFTPIDPVNFVFQYQNNIDELTARGIEVQAQHALWDNKLSINVNYTFTEREGVTLLTRIPKHKLNASARARVLDKTFVTATYQFNDSRGDFFFNNSTFSSEAVTLDSFQTVDLDITHTLTSKPVVFFAGVSNLLDADFQELFGFETVGRNFKLGVRLNF
jgi:vitamin B12 transporter